MNRDRDGRKTDGCLDELLKIDRMRIVSSTLGDLQHHWCSLFFAGLDDGLEKFHIVYIEGTEGVFALQSLRKQVTRVGQWHISGNW